MRATLRWAHADLRDAPRRGAVPRARHRRASSPPCCWPRPSSATRPTPGSGSSPSRRAPTSGLHTAAAADAGELAGLDGVESVAGPYPTAAPTVASRGSRASVELRGTRRPSPEAGRPLLTSGRWLDPATPDGVVLESSLARALLAEPGDTLTVPGTARQLTVVGVADSAEPRYRPGRADRAWSGRSRPPCRTRRPTAAR